MHHRIATIDGLEVFYREAGPDDAPLLILLHDFPAASHQYATLIDRLADQFYLLAPDYPGFGYGSAPASGMRAAASTTRSTVSRISPSTG